MPTATLDSVLQDRPWLQSYPANVPAEIDPHAYESLKALLEESCRRYADLPAFTNMGATLTFRELDVASRDFAAYLQHELGLAKGDRVSIMLPNVLQYPVALFGVLRAGLTAVNTNPLYTARELEHQLNDSGARAIVVLENFAHTVQEVLPKVRLDRVIVTGLGDLMHLPKSFIVNFAVRHVKHLVPAWHIEGAVPLKETLALGRLHPLRDVPLSHDDLAFLQYTGGTTGVPKGAMLTHGNMVANLEQTHAWIRDVLEAGRELIVTPLPLYHIFSLTVNLLTFVKMGGHNLLITNPRDLDAFIEDLSKVKFTAISGVNTLYNALLSSPHFDRVDASAVKVSVGAGAAVQRSVGERWKQRTGKPLLEGYGLTETSPVACVNPLTIEDFTGMIGLPVPSTEVSIRDDDGNPLPIGQAGEICIRGPQVMKGYWQRPEETAKVMLPGGWLRTGDIGVMNERGWVKFVERKKDMIVVSGFKVFPNEVEEVASTHPGVFEAAAVGVPDERTGEAVKLVVVKKDPALDAASVIEHCRRNLTAYKVPKVVEFRSELPKSPIGKVLRRELRNA